MYFHYKTLFAVWKSALRAENFSCCHLFFITVFTTLFLLLRSIVWCVWQLDNLFYPNYKKQRVNGAIFIIGNPRSGTTFTHRLMSYDEGFVNFKLVDTIFPAVIFFKLFALFGKMDRWVGSPLTRVMNKISDTGFKGWNDIHKTGPREVESDEMLFVYTMLSPLIGLLFPYFDAIPYARFVDQLPAEEKKKIMAYYLSCLKRHMYAAGPDKILLEKVALIAARLESVLEVLPDIRLVHLVRHPYESIPSLISMFAIPWKTLSPKAAENPRTYRMLVDLIFDYYRQIFKVRKILPDKQFLEIKYADLVDNPRLAVERIYTHFNLPLSRDQRQLLEKASQETRNYKSKHHYSLEQFGLSKQQIYTELKEIFDTYGFEP